MIVYVVMRPEDFCVLAVFSSMEAAKMFQTSLHGGGRDTNVSKHVVDEEEG
ncbi:hypothetical protein LCGC14_0455280 [marine sediment metagenome]|uniref:DUF1330 domain-containing protein n=1 Tax=marine sediment metagenome TaxID=412755 RepID=A0A0F9SLW3_9ZZZZ